VTQWNDKSGNANNATATGTPVYTPNSINNLSSIYLGRNPYFTGSVSITGTTFTCFAVATTTASLPLTGTDQRLVSLSNGTNFDFDGSNRAAALFNRTATNTIGTYRADTVIANNPIVSNTPFIAVSQYNGTNGYLWLNGSPGSLPSFASSGTFAITKYGIGDEANPTGEYWQGYIGEVIIFNTSLTDNQRQQVEGYLAHKWNLINLLPSSHAYIKITP
jgi:hypothetical protein